MARPSAATGSRGGGGFCVLDAPRRARAAAGVVAAGRRRDGELQVRALDPLVLAEQDRPLEHVLELADVAGPRMRLERRDRVVGDADDLLLQPLVELLDDVLHEQRDVADPLAQRRDLQRHHVEPVVEVVAEVAALDLGLEVAVGRGHEPHVDLERLDAADALELALLDRAQQLDLHLDGDLADLVEEQRAAVGELEPPGLARRGAGERALLVAEQLRLHQRLRDRGAVDLDERPVLTARVLMQRLGDELLAGATLARDQHRRRRVGDLVDHLVDREHLIALADEPVAAFDLGLDRVQRRPRLRPVRDRLADRLVDDHADLVLLERLLDVVERAGLDRLDGLTDRAVRRDHDDRHVRVVLARRAQHLHAVGAGHAQIGDHDVDIGEPLDRLEPVRGLHDLVAIAAQQRGEHATQVLLVVGYEDLRRLHDPLLIPSIRSLRVESSRRSRWRRRLSAWRSSRGGRRSR